MATLAELLEAMNAALPKFRRTRIPQNRHISAPRRYDGHSCHCALSCDCRELDGDDAPTLLHSSTPWED